MQMSCLRTTDVIIPNSCAGRIYIYVYPDSDRFNICLVSKSAQLKLYNLITHNTQLQVWSDALKLCVKSDNYDIARQLKTPDTSLG